MNESFGHQDVQELLPWFATGSLNEADTQVVDQHLQDCADCRVELDQVLATARSFNRSDTSGSDRLMMDRQEESLVLLLNQVRDTTQTTPTSVSAVMPNPSRTTPLLATVATLLIALSGALFVQGPDYDAASFELMTAPQRSDYPIVQILFHPQVPERDMRLLLLDMGGQLTGSPSPKGIYRVRLQPDQDTIASLQQIVQRLRQHPSVRWADVEL